MKVPKQPLARRPGTPLQADRAPPGVRRDVAFEVDGTPLSAWLYLPEDLSKPVPCIVMAQGLGGTKEMLLEDYALRYREAGFAVLTFDYRHFGKSGGEPRQLAWIPYQQDDCSAAIEYARGLHEVDPARVALWGTSLGGGHVMVMAAEDSRIACVCAQVPLLHGSAGGMRVLKRVGINHALRMLTHGQRDLVRSWFGLPPHTIPIVGRPGTTALFADAEVWESFEQMAPDGFVNEVCARITIRMDKYRPVKHAGRIRCPVLLQICEKDVGVPRRIVEEAERRLGGRAEVTYYPIDHFDIYGDEHFERAVRDQLTFFRKHLYHEAR